MENNKSIQQLLETVLEKFPTESKKAFGKDNILWQHFLEIERAFSTHLVLPQNSNKVVKWSLGQGNWATIPWIAFLDPRETEQIENGVYGVILFRADMSGVYLALIQGVSEPLEKHGAVEGKNFLRNNARTIRAGGNALEENGFKTDDLVDLRTSKKRGKNYEIAIVAYKFYEVHKIPVDKIVLQDLDNLLQFYDQYINAKFKKPQDNILPSHRISENEEYTSVESANDLQNLIEYIEHQGYVFEPWQIAAYVTALRTKPFVILAGISGTGKSKLPALVAQGTGGEPHLISVRPDWTDSSDVLGYVNLQDEFKPGVLLHLAKQASETPDKHFVAIVDEMNLARVEHYFAEILSQIENRKPAANGGFSSDPLVVQKLSGESNESWASIGLPPNLAIVGTVNMDESTHGFSRKVLDRAFTLEFSDINLAHWKNHHEIHSEDAINWLVSAWFPRATRLSQLENLNDDDLKIIDRVISTLIQINDFLKPAQLQVGFRTRDEVVMFVLHAHEIETYFITSEGKSVDPLDLALQMKILPRIVGGSNAIRQVILNMLAWAVKGKNLPEDEIKDIVDLWIRNGRPLSIEADYPRTAARLCLMWERLDSEGFTSFWL